MICKSACASPGPRASPRCRLALFCWLPAGLRLQRRPGRAPVAARAAPRRRAKRAGDSTRTGPSAVASRSARPATAATPASRWRQRGADYDIRLSAPITRQSWRLRAASAGGSPSKAWKAVPAQGADAEALLREATGWRDAGRRHGRLGRGARAARAGRAAVRIRAACRRTLLQDGWTDRVRWLDHRRAAAAERIFARRADAASGWWSRLGAP